MRTVDQDRAAEVFGIAIAEAVRRAVKDVGRDRLPSEVDLSEATPEPAVEDDADVIDLTVTALGDDLDAPVAPVEPVDPYEVLGVSPRASWDEIVGARNQLLRTWHPDAGGDQERFLTLNAAFAELRIRRAR